jgi:hypothetical protein
MSEWFVVDASQAVAKMRELGYRDGAISRYLRDAEISAAYPIGPVCRITRVQAREPGMFRIRMRPADPDPDEWVWA